MMTAYDQRCAYLAMFIERTGAPTIDHVIPKSKEWDCVYEWSNYRLCTGIVNSKKGELLGLVDPIDVKIGWFGLDLTYLEHRAPFIAHELRRQGQLMRGDV